MTLQAVREGIKEALAGIPGLNVYGYLALHPEPPCAVVGWDDEDPNIYLNQLDELYHIDVVLYVGLTDDQTADLVLMGFKDDILAALRDAPDLFNACSSQLVTRIHDFGTAPLGDGGPNVLGCIISIEVMS
jgi:hypothetical protein